MKKKKNIHVSKTISELIDAKIELALLVELGIPHLCANADADEQNRLWDTIERLEKQLKKDLSVLENKA